MDNSLEKDIQDLIKTTMKTKGNDITWGAIERVTLPEHRLIYRKYFIELGGQVPEKEIFKIAIEVRENEAVKIFKI
jgi:hypothetical protein